MEASTALPGQAVSDKGGNVGIITEPARKAGIYKGLVSVMWVGSRYEATEHPGDLTAVTLFALEPAPEPSREEESAVSAEAPAVREEEALGLRLAALTRELRDRNIRRDLWPSIRETAEGVKTVRELDKYLDRMEIHHSRLL